MVCRCYPPPYTTDSPEICEAIGGTCMPLELEYPPSGPVVGMQRRQQANHPPPVAACPPPIQRHMMIPFELCPDYVKLEDPRFRGYYIWDEDDQ